MRPTAIVLILALTTALSAQTLVRTIEGVADGDACGLVARTVGDVNKDGHIDFAVGSPGDDSNGKDAGSVTVYSGVDAEVLYVFRGAHARDEFGYSLAGAGDVDKDGYDDVIIGAPYEDHQAEKHLYANAGSAQVFSGRDGKLIHTFRGPFEGDAMGWSVGALDDVNRDGHAEIVVGVPFYDRTHAPDIGLVMVYSGKSGALLYKLEGNEAGDRFGWALGSIGETKDRRARNLVVGIEGSSNRKDKRYGEGRLVQAGSTKVFSGLRGRLLQTLRTGQDQDYFGTAVASAGDVDGDGKEDLLVGAWNGENNLGERTGIATLFSGSNGKVLLQVAGTTAFDHFGAAVATLGDLDGDSRPDFAIGAPQEPAKGSGYVRVFSGATGEILFTLIGEAIGDLFGTSVCAMPDQNKDGLGDVMVGAPGLRKRGGVQVYTSPAR